MSIFGTKDRDVPMLTQVYQLEVPSMNHPDGEHPFYHGDLDRWLGIDTGGEYWSDSATNPAMWVFGTSSLANDAATAPIWKSDQIEGRFRHLSAIIALVKRIMRDVCDTQTLGESDAAELSKFVKLWPQTLVIVWKPGANGRVDLKDMHLQGPSESTAAVEWRVVQALRAALSKAQSDPDYFQRCQQCHNVFLRENRRQVFCSQRCNSQAKTRQFRIREAAEKKVSVTLTKVTSHGIL